MWFASVQGWVINISFTFLFVRNVGALAYTTLHTREEHCDGSRYCEDRKGLVIWKNECGLERPSKESWERKKDESIDWFEEQFNLFQETRRSHDLQEDETSFPAWFAKRFAPNHPPSSTNCHGLSSCSAPSCTDLASFLSDTEKEHVQFAFEFFSILDHTHHAVNEATQDFFIGLNYDIEWVTKEFTYADELQEHAVEKQSITELVTAMISALLLITAVFTGGLSLYATPIIETSAKAAQNMGRLGNIARKMSRAVQRAARAAKWPGRDIPGKEGVRVKNYGEGLEKQFDNLNSAMGGIVVSAFIGTTGLMNQANKIKHGDDVKGYDKTLEAFKHFMAGMVEDATYQNANDIANIFKGGKNANDENLLDLYKSGVYSHPDIDLRGYLKYKMDMYFTARVVGSLWQQEGVYIVESTVLEGGTCDQDTRGPNTTRICLYDRPGHTYNIQAITHYDDHRIREPPGLKHFTSQGGYKGLTLEDIVRSSLFQDEIWRPYFKEGERYPDVQVILSEEAKDPSKWKRDVYKHNVQKRTLSEPVPETELDSLDEFGWYTDSASTVSLARANRTSDTIQILDHYGDVPAAISLGVCRSWSGQAISDIKHKDGANAPCICDPPARSLASSWENPNNWTLSYTRRFVNDSKLYLMEEYGKMCRKDHGCNKSGKWKDLLNLREDLVEVPKKMEDAWDKCSKPGKPYGGVHHDVPEISGTRVVTMGDQVLSIPSSEMRHTKIEIKTVDNIINYEVVVDGVKTIRTFATTERKTTTYTVAEWRNFALPNSTTTVTTPMTVFSSANTLSTTPVPTLP